MKKNHYYLMPRLFIGKLFLLTTFLSIGFMTPVLAQKTYTYSGTVANKQGETLPGVNVVVKGLTSVGASTDINGKFSFTSGQPTETLIFSFIGAVTQEIQAKAGTPVNIVLEEKAIGLSELVVVGYGTQKKSVVTGAITSVKGSDLNNMQIPRIEQALQGRTSGLTIASSSGQPGAGSTVRVRGTTSINNSDPLYVVDGVPVDNGGIDYLNSADIESIEVLKDAASAAIYGARAASGVILVSTKKGKSGSMQVSYNAYFGTQAPAKKLDLLNATQYATLMNEASIAGGGSKIYPNPESLGNGTDWQGTIFNNSAGIQNHEVSISGGNDRSTYYTSFGYFDQEGIVATSISNYKRINLRFNSVHKVTDWLRFGNNIGYSHIKSMGSLNTNSEYGGPLASAINLDPITPTIITNDSILNTAPYNNQPVVKDGNGNPYGISDRVVQEMTNPLAYIQTRQGNYGWSDNFVGNVYAEVEPIKGLKFRSDAGAKLAFWGDESFTPVYYLNASTSNLVNNSFYRGNNKGLIWNIENTASYTKSLGSHNFTGLIGVSAFVENSKGVNTRYYNIPVNNFDDASMNYSVADANKLGGGWENPDHKVSSLFARLIYNFSEKYLFTGIIRQDGSSRFGSNNKYGMFPSASVGWVASREGFWPSNKVVTFLKVRGSYGVTGNDAIGDFQYVSTVSGGRNYTFGFDNYVIGYSPNAPGNPDLKWEETSQSNIGFEASILEDFSLVFDLYSKNTTGMLRPIILPAYVGSGNPTGNVASMTNKGVELEVGYRKQLGDLYVDVKGNTSYLKNEVTDLGTVQFLEGANFQSSTYAISRFAVGHPIGAFYGFESLGIFRKQSDVLNYTDPATGKLIQPNAQPGDIKFKDINGRDENGKLTGKPDGKIDADDRTFIGDPTPTWSYGFTASANYRGFDILVFGQGVSGNQIFNGLRRLDIASANWTTEAMNRWTTNNPLTDFPRLINGDPNKNFSNPSSFYLSDGSYFRIKTLQIGYSLPKSFINKIGLQKLRFYVSSNNLITFTKYAGYDPEIGGSSYGIDRGVYPQARSFMAGVNVSF
jgi:TonB-linked SusC/RagA family outer membrane protein